MSELDKLLKILRISIGLPFVMWVWPIYILVVLTCGLFGFVFNGTIFSDGDADFTNDIKNALILPYEFMRCIWDQN